MIDLDNLFRVPRNHEGPAQGRDISLVIWQVYKQTLHSQDLLSPNFSLSRDRHQTTISPIAEDWKLRIFPHLKVVLTSFLGETCPDSPLLSSRWWVRASFLYPSSPSLPATFGDARETFLIHRDSLRRAWKSSPWEESSILFVSIQLWVHPATRKRRNLSARIKIDLSFFPLFWG